MNRKQSGNVEVSEQVVTWIVNLVMAVGGGVFGGAAAYFNIREDIAVINTKLQYIQRDVSDVKEALRPANGT